LGILVVSGGGAGKKTVGGVYARKAPEVQGGELGLGEYSRSNLRWDLYWGKKEGLKNQPAL